MQLSNYTHKAFLIIVVFLLQGLPSFAQVVTTYPLQENKVIKQFIAQNPGYTWNNVTKQKWGQKDTLTLPFFDDFSTSSIYPDSSKWLNNQVYINNHFPIYPPTLNVATFDVLNASGRPYNLTINKDFNSAGDSLISQPINLKDSAGVAISVADSIMLSFFFQANGYGYHLTGEDSIRLFFKADNNTWFQVWSAGGKAVSEPFEHVIIPLTNPNFLHEDFQFMFTTYTRQVGNANQWHIDYVYLDKRRSKQVDYYNDYAIQTTPSPLIKGYSQMPYSHFALNPGSHIADSIFVYVSNLYNVAKNIEIRQEADFKGNSIESTSFSTNANNVLAQANAERRMEGFGLTGLDNQLPVVINHKVEIRERGVQNDFRANDFMEVKQVFSDYYAYDDGSAERGFGFDQNTNPSNIEGAIALKFNVLKRDTLYAIGTYFNEAVYDVSTSQFQYRIWKSIKGIDGAGLDSVIYHSDDLTPEYRVANGMRTFAAHYPDTLLVLDPGTYYIGWHQRSMFNLNVGWDMNFGNKRNPNTVSPNLYYQVFDKWNSTDLPNGTLMLRPHFGSVRELYAGVSKPERIQQKLTVYPNPASSVFYLNQEFATIQLVSYTGEIIKVLENTNQMSIIDVPSGMYIVLATNAKGEMLKTKLCIFAH